MFILCFYIDCHDIPNIYLNIGVIILIKMLVVDDEEIIREGICRAGNWVEHGIEVIGSAGNGIAALEIIKEDKPDIILSDVVMPEIDGIELSKTVYEKYPGIKIILLSGYDDFQYARSAIEYKVSNYLLKPVKLEVLLDEVLKLKARIEREAEKKRKDDMILQELRKSLPILREQYLNRIICYGLEDYEKIKKEFDYLEIGLSLFNVGVMLVQPDNYTRRKQYVYEEEYYLTKLKLKELCDNIIESDKGCVVFEDREDRTVILFNFSEGNTHGKSIDIIVKKARMLQQEILEQLGLSVSIGIGRLQKSITGIAKSYKEAVSALEYKFYMGSESVIYFGDVDIPDSFSCSYPQHLEFDIILNVRAGSYVKACSLVDDFFDEIQADGILKPDEILCTGLFLLNGISRVILGNLCEFEHDKSLNAVNIMLETADMRFDTLNQLKSHIFNIVKKITDCVNASRKLRNISLIQSAKDFIKRNVGNNISLNTVADMLYISPNYLSFLFKEETGENFKDYVLKKKIEEGKKLLKDTNYTLNRIAADIGYSDGRYFSHIFKKYTGVSPEEWRNSDKQ